ncbi:MAG: outer membrane beta-barrel protein [Deltaproteobacteria bacterium]
MKKRSDIIAVAIFLLLYLPASIHAAGIPAEPGLRFYVFSQEEYNDNINLTPTNKKASFITTVGPGVKYNKTGVKSSVDLEYSLGFVNYGKDSGDNNISQNGTLNVKYLTKEHINFYLKESFIQSDEPRELEALSSAADNKYVLSISPERALYWRNIIEPTIEYQFGPENRVGFTYRNNTYSTTSTFVENSQENYINLFFDYWLNKRNGIHLDYGNTIGTFQISPGMNAQKLNARYTNRFNQRSSIYGDFALLRRHFDASSGDYDIYESYAGTTHAFTPTLNASAQVGYFMKNPTSGSRIDGLSYKAGITKTDVLTTYTLSLQGGYTEDFFTSQNLGFSKYDRFTGSVVHFLEKRMSIGLSVALEQAELNQGRKELIWGVEGTLSHRPLKWLTMALVCSHKTRDSNVEGYGFDENRGMVKITVSY